MRIFLLMRTSFCLVIASAVQAKTDNSLGDIWFLGDSITQSNADGDRSGSPRESLYKLLTDNDYSFSFTGHHTLNVDGLPTSGIAVADNLYHYHSGISGSMIGDDYGKRVGMTENMASFWDDGRLAVVKPSIILIMLGTNDIGKAYDVSNAPARLKILIETIYDLPDIGAPTIYLASIPPNGRNAIQTANVIAFNAAIPEIVSDFHAEGKDIHFVDQFTPLNGNYANVMRGDNLHPNATGNTVMAQTWFDAISAPTQLHSQ